MKLSTISDNSSFNHVGRMSFPQSAALTHFPHMPRAGELGINKKATCFCARAGSYHAEGWEKSAQNDRFGL